MALSKAPSRLTAAAGGDLICLKWLKVKKRVVLYCIVGYLILKIVKKQKLICSVVGKMMLIAPGHVVVFNSISLPATVTHPHPLGTKTLLFNAPWQRKTRTRKLDDLIKQMRLTNQLTACLIQLYSI